MAIGGPSDLPPVDSVYAQPSRRRRQRKPGHGDGGAGAKRRRGGTAAAPPRPQHRNLHSSSKRSHRNDGPGTPRYNLMLSLGGVY